MMAHPIRAAAESFLALLREEPESDEDAELERLAQVLDALAVATHELTSPFDDTDHPDPPDWPDSERRDLATRRFPMLGFYNAALPISQDVGSAKVVVGDAIDDLADIAGELAEVVWRFEHTSESDAVWHADLMHRMHWGVHLRQLQLAVWSQRVDW